MYTILVNFGHELHCIDEIFIIYQYPKTTNILPPPPAKPHPLVFSTPKRLKHVPVGGDRHSYTYRLRRF